MFPSGHRMDAIARVSPRGHRERAIERGVSPIRHEEGHRNTGVTTCISWTVTDLRGPCQPGICRRTGSIS
jgi:hypothetical protein